MISDRRHPCGTWDWRDSVVSAHQVPWGLAGLSPFSPAGTLGTGDTQVLQAPKAPWGLVGLSPQSPKYPGDWRDSALSAA